MTDLECIYDDTEDSKYGDLKLSDDGQPYFATSDLQHQYDILRSSQGFFKHYPEVGVDSWSYLNDSEKAGYLRTIRKQLSADGMKVRSVSYDPNGNIKIDAEYENR